MFLLRAAGALPHPPPHLTPSPLHPSPAEESLASPVKFVVFGGGLAPDMARMGLLRLILDVLAAWPQIWPESTPEGFF